MRVFEIWGSASSKFAQSRYSRNKQTKKKVPNCSVLLVHSKLRTQRFTLCTLHQSLIGGAGKSLMAAWVCCSLPSSLLLSAKKKNNTPLRRSAHRCIGSRSRSRRKYAMWSEPGGLTATSWWKVSPKSVNLRARRLTNRKLKTTVTKDGVRYHHGTLQLQLYIDLPKKKNKKLLLWSEPSSTTTFVNILSFLYNVTTSLQSPLM